ncbi:hypothetical protein ES706_06387 [subsurface metagenome]
MPNTAFETRNLTVDMEDRFLVRRGLTIMDVTRVKVHADSSQKAWKVIP